MNDDTSAKQLDEINQDFETRAYQQQAQEAGLQFIDLLHYPINPDVLSLVDVEDAEGAQAMPFFKNGKQLRVAAVNPKSAALDQILQKLSKAGYVTEVWLCSASGFAHTFKLFDSDLAQRKKVEVRHEFDEDAKLTFEIQFKGFENLIKTLELVPVNQALNEIEIAAIQAKASDIHLQPYEKYGELRFRIDGILHTVGQISASKAKTIVGQIKYESGMKANITDVPQDGRITFRANDRKIDLRVSSLPTEYSESIVMRVLDSERGIKSFSELGFDDYKESKIVEVLKKKNGMVLVTGPTGSGKTTTLYAMLKELNDPERKLVTLEDPIEYHLENVIQSQVNSNGEYDFGNGLRALLRHDPDVMLIGEIRDLDTAKLAAEAALTGHVVLSSLHTNSALGAIARLRNLGLESFNIASSINAIFAQRLVRRSCSHCQEKQVLELSKEPKITKAIERVLVAYPELEARINQPTSTSVQVTGPSVKGCEHCSHASYDGQTVLAEVVFLTDDLREKVSGHATEVELEKYVKSKNPQFLTLFEDGIRKMILGETTLEEVYRVAG